MISHLAQLSTQKSLHRQPVLYRSFILTILVICCRRADDHDHSGLPRAEYCGVL